MGLNMALSKMHPHAEHDGKAAGGLTLTDTDQIRRQ
jgi:hypothetical protein